MSFWARRQRHTPRCSNAFCGHGPRIQGQPVRPVRRALPSRRRCAAWGFKRPPADLLVLATCCLTAEALRKGRQALRRALRACPHAAVLVVGCYSDYDPHAIARIADSLNVPPDKLFLAGHHDDLAERISQTVQRLGRTGQALPAAPRKTRGQPSGRPRLVGRNLGRNIATKSSDCQACSVHAPNPTSIKARRLDAVKANVAGRRPLPPIDRFDGHQPVIP